MERVVPQIFEHIDGNPDEDIPPSDDPARDMLAVMDAMESMAASMYQGLVEKLSVRRAAGRGDACSAPARHASRRPWRSPRPAPRTPTSARPCYGEEVVPDESGLIPLYAIPAQFGTLNPYQLVIGAASSAGTRFTMPIETPADNSYVYTGQTCDT